jgi:hypothetical protein
MKKLESKKFRLPTIFLISDRSEIKEIPIGIPFIFADKEEEDSLIRLFEYEFLYQAAMKSGYPFNFRKILEDNGYNDLETFSYNDSVYMEFVTEGMIEEECDVETIELTKFKKEGSLFQQFIKDNSVYVDIAKLKELNVFPVWLDKIEEAISTNIHNFAVFNNNMYNKKLEGMYGSLELTSPKRNLIIIDISGSIPRGVSSTCLSLAKNLCETFYADVLITGSKSILFNYENIHELNINTIYEIGMNNDQTYFKALLESEEKHYATAIVFGDNDYPGDRWQSARKYISDADGKKLCKWKIDHLISFHTKGIEHLAAYGRWFSPTSEERIKDWVKYLDK